MIIRIFTLLLAVAFLGQANAQNFKRPMRPGDIYRLQNMSDANISPDGKWVAFTMSTTDSARDKRNSDIWMINTGTKETVQLTSSPDGESSPRWSPDGKFISFVASRHSGTSQVWLLDRRGGEGIKLTDVKGDLDTYAWSPDSKMLVMSMKDQKDTAKNKPPQPYILNRFKIKQDVSGYLYDTGRTHLYLFNIAAKKTSPLTSGLFNEGDPNWSPDGKTIAFVSNRSSDPDRNENRDIWLIDTTAGSTPRQLTTWQGGDGDPQWSPDGKQIAYVRSMSDATYEMYDQSGICIINANGGEPKILAPMLDRPISSPRWSTDGKMVYGLVSDDMQRYIASFDAKTGTIKKVVGGDRSFGSMEVAPDGSIISFMSSPQMPGELYSVNGENVNRLTTFQNKVIDSLALASVEKFVSTSKDGAKVSGLVYYPAGMPKTNLPLIFYIHGGPTAQDEFSFDVTRQMFAAHGYAVAAVNYRGSIGRGLAFTKAISGDWGNKEVLDILGATDYLVEKGIADPNKLGMSGWSYGGILTDYIIASTTRFKVASSGAGVAAPLSLFGVDQYINQYVNEIGLPWKDGNLEKYLQLSYPFLHADKITTPTQFMVGEKDFNVPAVGSEQMYQALRIVGVPTELLVYPNQYHGFSQPSFIKDRYERYFSWFDKYLK